jgi:hypothetical protein
MCASPLRADRGRFPERREKPLKYSYRGGTIPKPANVRVTGDDQPKPSSTDA